MRDWTAGLHDIYPVALRHKNGTSSVSRLFSFVSRRGNMISQSPASHSYRLLPSAKGSCIWGNYGGKTILKFPSTNHSCRWPYFACMELVIDCSWYRGWCLPCSTASEHPVFEPWQLPTAGSLSGRVRVRDSTCTNNCVTGLLPFSPTPRSVLVSMLSTSTSMLKLVGALT